MALAWSLDKIGPMCRSAEDCGLVLQVIAGADPQDPGSAGKSFYYTPEYSRKMSDLKVGFAAVDLEWAEPEARSVFDAAMKQIAAIGVGMVEAKLPDFPYGALVGTVVSAEGSSIFEPLISSGKVNELADERQIAGLKAGLEIPAKDYLKAMRIRSLVKRKFHEFFADIDVIVAPARYAIAPKISEPLDAGRQGSSPSTPGMTGLIAAGNLAGLPALSLPCGFTQGMPLALQLVGPAFSENTLLAIARQFQKQTDWHKKHPPV
jgi:aspartyl-tRNA(Asn)/glutamyl-tRNA(Gln) amidotransferase subunit A